MKSLKDFLSIQEYHLGEEHKAWDALVDKIRKNPNQMNVMGVWQQEQIQVLNIIFSKIHCRERYVQELKEYIARKPFKPIKKPRKRLRK